MDKTARAIELISTLNMEELEHLENIMQMPTGMDGLRYIMGRYGDTIKALAKAMGTTEKTLSRKIETGNGFRLHDCSAIIARYKLTSIEAEKIFFA